MELFKPIPFVSSFIDDLNNQFVKDGNQPLSRIHRYKLQFLLTIMIITGRLNIAQASRISFNKFTEFMIRWFIHHSYIVWKKLYQSSIRMTLRKYNITTGKLVIDDTERLRANSTKEIFGVHKIKNKKVGGYNIAQEFVTTVLITKKITILIDCVPYIPDPEINKWKKREKERIANNKNLSAKNKRKPEPMPERSKKHPTKEQIAASSVCRFGYYFPEIGVESILFDAAYNTEYLVGVCTRRYPKAQIISKIAKNQLVANKSGQYIPVHRYFSKGKAREYVVRVRGYKDTIVEVKSARLHIKSLNRSEHVVAVRYKGQTEFRYQSATDMSWRAQDIIFENGFRWLIEVVHEDWKLYEGYGRAATQRGYTGFECGLGLSSLVDTCLLNHPEQVRLAQSNQSLRTVGTMVRKAESTFLLQTIEEFLECSNPKDMLKNIAALLEAIHKARHSRKHLSGSNLEDSVRDPPS